MRKRILTLTMGLLLGISQLHAQNLPPVTEAIYSKVFSYTAAQTPEYWNGFLVLTFEADYPVRYVAAVFEHEDYQKKHVFFLKRGDGTGIINEDGMMEPAPQGTPIFILLYDPGDREDFTYRLVVDGSWMADPLAPFHSTDDFGNILSHFSLPEDRPRLINSPTPMENGRLAFFYRGTPGLRVSLVGNFNHWDPFMYPMNENPNDPGLYSLDIPMDPGDVYYYFMVGTRKVMDQLNPEIAHDGAGNPVSHYFHSPLPLAMER